MNLPPLDPVLAYFEGTFLRRLGAPTSEDARRIERLYGHAPRGSLGALVERRCGDLDVEIGPFMVLSAVDVWGDEEGFDVHPFETTLRHQDGRLLSAIFSDAVPIGRDGGGQEYVAHLADRSEIALFDPGQGELRFLASDLPTFVYLAKLCEESNRLIDELGLDDGDGKRDNHALEALKSDMALVAERINLADEVVTSDFAESLATTTGVTPTYRPSPSAIETLHDRASWLVLVLGMGYDSVSLEHVVDTFDAERADAQHWASAARRLYWLWSAFLLGQDERFERLATELSQDPSAWVSDSVRLIAILRTIDDPELAPDGLRDVVRARRSLSRLWRQRLAPTQVELPPEGAGLPSEVRRRTDFLASRGYARGKSAYTEEARECLGAIQHGGRELSVALLPYLDRPPSGGKADRQFNVTGAAMLPFDVAPDCKETLLLALHSRSASLSHLGVLPGVVRALGRLGARECVPALVELMTEFAVVWQDGYAKAGSVAVEEAVCDALADLGDDRGIDALVSVVKRDLNVSKSLRGRALFALAFTSWEPPEALVRDARTAGSKELVEWLLARRGYAPEVDERLLPVSSIAFSILCRAMGRVPGKVALDAAKLILRTVHQDPFVMRLSHRLALDVLEAGPASEEVTSILARTVRVALDEEVRRRAIELSRKRISSFAPTFCDRPNVDAAFDRDGTRGLASLLGAPCGVYRHNVFAKAAELGAAEVVLEYLSGLILDLATYRHSWAGPLAYAFETQLYAAIDCVRDLGAAGESELVSLWRASTIGRERVEYTLKDLGFDGVEAIERRITRVSELDRQGGSSYASGRYAEAAARYAELIDINPSIAPAWRNLGNAHLEAGKHEEALAAYEAASEIDPDDAPGWYWVSHALYRGQKWDAVMLAAKKGLAADPTSARCGFNLAIAYSALDRVDEAAAAFDALLERDLERWMIADIHLNRAILAVTRADLSGAQDAVKAAIRTDGAWLRYALAVPELVVALGEERIRSLAKAEGEGEAKG
jgi:tetratricopeptide (TPR) repeat protein